MDSSESEGCLAALSSLLEDRSLADSEILRRSDWEQRVKETTRPFLEEIAEEASLGKADYYQVDGDNVNVRECFDNVHWKPVARLRLAVRLGPLVGEDDAGTGLIYWGVFGWARNDGEFHGFTNRLKSIERRVSGFRVGEAPVAGIGGRYPMLLRSMDPRTLRGLNLSELVSDIAEDLRVLNRNLF